MISFTQNLISIRKNHANICWIVENKSQHNIEDAVAYSNLFCHNFGQLGIGSIKSITFEVPLEKTSLLDGAFINYFSDNQTVMLKSNILRNF